MSTNDLTHSDHDYEHRKKADQDMFKTSFDAEATGIDVEGAEVDQYPARDSR